jgi:hypothetical protein
VYGRKAAVNAEELLQISKTLFIGSSSGGLPTGPSLLSQKEICWHAEQHAH